MCSLQIFFFFSCVFRISYFCLSRTFISNALENSPVEASRLNCPGAWQQILGAAAKHYKYLDALT